MNGWQIVWYKRDLRLHDHPALASAAAVGPVLGLYVYEPSMLTSDEYDSSQHVFINACLQELRDGLAARGGRLLIRVGELPAVLDELAEALSDHGGLAALWSHQETGNRLTYDRDLRVGAWAKRRGIPWHEPTQNGVVRRLGDRDGWARRWNGRMSQAQAELPERLSLIQLPADHPSLADGPILPPESLGLPASTKPLAQLGGESVGLELLDSFLARRGVNYRADMSSPVTGWDGCSRLSPYLAWGAVSIRRVHQQTKARQQDVRAAKKDGTLDDGRWLQSLSSFQGRLRWHCHFMQKLEDEPALEFENMCRAYDGLREDEFDADRFAAWQAGRTGYPMVDACMRALHEAGWVNFRMRAMLVSFASYHLWLDWRPTSKWLGRHFLDFEPGIHYSQFQMQSGVTGINAIRIYSPIKQVLDQDPRGDFIRRWVPELAGVPTKHIAEPHKMSRAEQDAAGCVIGRHYPPPIVDHATAYREARARIYAARGKSDARAEAKAVYEKHGSRRRPNRRDRRDAKAD